MINILTSKQMKLTEKYTMEIVGIPSLVLMEKASMMAFYHIMRQKPSKILIVAGCGNNGGDGIALARMLLNAGVNVKVFLIGNTEKSTEENKIQQHAFKKINGSISYSINELINDTENYDIIVDALLGIGISRDIEGDYLAAVNYINSKSDSYIFSLDIPTGIHTDSGNVLGNAVKANETICFSEYKLGLLLNKGPDYSGKVTVYDVGIIPSSKIPSEYLNENNSIFSSDFIHSLKSDDIKSIMPTRNITGHKGSFGKILIIAGSEKMAGASLLSSKAAFHSGAGMVKLISSNINKADILANLPELMYSSYENMTDNELLESIEWSDIIVIGPGLSTNENAIHLVEFVMRNSKYPVIADADALNIISKNMSLLIERKEKLATTILTPHVGEFKRLFPDYSPSDPFAVSKLAEKYGSIIVAKNSKTIISDGISTFINTTGNNGMATAGSGDVLAGMIAAFTHNISDRLLGVALSVYLHGEAGDKAVKDKNEYSITASDIINHIF